MDDVLYAKRGEGGTNGMKIYCASRRDVDIIDKILGKDVWVLVHIKSRDLVKRGHPYGLKGYIKILDSEPDELYTINFIGLLSRKHLLELQAHPFLNSIELYRNNIEVLTPANLLSTQELLDFCEEDEYDNYNTVDYDEYGFFIGGLNNDESED